MPFFFGMCIIIYLSQLWDRISNSCIVLCKCQKSCVLLTYCVNGRNVNEIRNLTSQKCAQAIYTTDSGKLQRYRIAAWGQVLSKEHRRARLNFVREHICVDVDNRSTKADFIKYSNCFG